jgi:precorrin-2 C20-methyltransferase / precorrin-3B C17-methyltransferase
VLLPSHSTAAGPLPVPVPVATAPVEAGQVAVVRLGPAGREWLTPEAQAALAAADELVGYGPYLDRVPANPRQRRRPTTGCGRSVVFTARRYPA